MKHKFCKKNEHPSFHLYPDYSSCGVWCEKCGLEMGDLEVSLPNIPKSLIDLIHGWVLLWDVITDDIEGKGKINLESVEPLLISMGIELARQVNEYYPCSYNEKINLFGWLKRGKDENKI